MANTGVDLALIDVAKIESEGEAMQWKSGKAVVGHTVLVKSSPILVVENWLLCWSLAVLRWVVVTNNRKYRTFKSGLRRAAFSQVRRHHDMLRAARILHSSLLAP